MGGVVQRLAARLGAISGPFANSQDLGTTLGGEAELRLDAHVLPMSLIPAFNQILVIDFPIHLVQP
jgi:hypothetical protein